MNTEDMKMAWRDTARSLNTSPSAETIEKIRIGKQSTSLDRLGARYFRFVMLSACCTILSLSFMLVPWPTPYKPIWLSLAFMVYFLTCSAMDFWLYRGIGSIDCLRMPVSAVIKKALYYRKRHLQFVLTLLPMAFGVVFLLAFYYNFDRSILFGMIIGGTIGLAIGSYQLFEFMRDYRKITDFSEK